MKNLFLSIAIIIIASLGFAGCNDDKKTENPTKLPIILDYSQIEMTDSTINVKNGTFNGTVSEPGADGTAIYKQNGLEIQISGAFSNIYSVPGIMWLFPAKMTIRNINSLKGLSKISFDWYVNYGIFEAFLYDENGNIVDKKSNNNTTENRGTAEFTKDLDKASYFVTEGGENYISSIKFE